MKRQISPYLRACTDACSNCHDACLQTISQHMEMGGKPLPAKHFHLMLDCIAICNTTRDFLLRMSDYDAEVCAACATICQACAEGCEQLGDMADCARACRACAERFGEMLQDKR